MADDAAKSPSPFDVKTIKYLVGLMSQHDLSEIDLRDGPVRVRLRRGASEAVSPALPVASVPASLATQAVAPSPPPEPDKAGKPVQLIKSPTPGTFYSAPSPEAEPFVKVGSRVTPGTVVCIIEAMKIFNEITADCTGVVTEVLAENQQPVEFGQVLFKVDPTG